MSRLGRSDFDRSGLSDPGQRRGFGNPLGAILKAWGSGDLTPAAGLWRLLPPLKNVGTWTPTAHDTAPPPLDTQCW